MHRTLFALALAANLLAPSGLLARLWDLLPGRAENPASAILEKEGPGLDPDGATAPVPPAEEGPGWDPDGRS
jgi:hypothetical protein